MYQFWALTTITPRFSRASGLLQTLHQRKHGDTRSTRVRFPPLPGTQVKTETKTIATATFIKNYTIYHLHSIRLGVKTVLCIVSFRFSPRTPKKMALRNFACMRNKQTNHRHNITLVLAHIISHHFWPSLFRPFGRPRKDRNFDEVLLFVDIFFDDEGVSPRSCSLPSSGGEALRDHFHVADPLREERRRALTPSPPSALP